MLWAKVSHFAPNTSKPLWARWVLVAAGPHGGYLGPRHRGDDRLSFARKLCYPQSAHDSVMDEPADRLENCAGSETFRFLLGGTLRTPRSRARTCESNSVVKCSMKVSNDTTSPSLPLTDVFGFVWCISLSSAVYIQERIMTGPLLLVTFDPRFSHIL